MPQTQGVIVIVFALSFPGVFELNIFRGGRSGVKKEGMGFFPALLLADAMALCGVKSLDAIDRSVIRPPR